MQYLRSSKLTVASKVSLPLEGDAVEAGQPGLEDVPGKGPVRGVGVQDGDEPVGWVRGRRQPGGRWPRRQAGGCAGEGPHAGRRADRTVHT